MGEVEWAQKILIWPNFLLMNVHGNQGPIMWLKVPKKACHIVTAMLDAELPQNQPPLADPFLILAQAE